MTFGDVPKVVTVVSIIDKVSVLVSRCVLDLVGIIHQHLGSELERPRRAVGGSSSRGRLTVVPLDRGEGEIVLGQRSDATAMQRRISALMRSSNSLRVKCFSRDTSNQ